MSAQLGLADRDPRGKLQEYLSIYQPAAIRQAAVIVTVRLDRGDLQCAHAHRYLTKGFQSTQESLNLERQEAELLELCCWLAQDWLSMERAEFAELQRNSDPLTLACALAERAAWGGLPVAGAVWTERLLEHLERAQHVIGAVRRFLVRLYEAPSERRLSLLDRIATLQCRIVQRATHRSADRRDGLRTRPETAHDVVASAADESAHPGRPPER